MTIDEAQSLNRADRRKLKKLIGYMIPSKANLKPQPTLEEIRELL